MFTTKSSDTLQKVASIVAEQFTILIFYNAT